MRHRLLPFLLGLLLFSSVGVSAFAAAEDTRVTLKTAALNTSALQPGQQAVAAVVVDIKPGYHTQSHAPSKEEYIKFELAPDEQPGVTFYAPVYPPGKDETYGAIDPDKPLNVYSGTITIYVPFELKPDAKPGPMKLSGKVEYQACDDKSCYAPASKAFGVETAVVVAGEAVQPQNAELFKDFDPTTFSRVAAAGVPAETPKKILGLFVLTDNSYVTAFVLAFLSGIIFNAVPCVLPVLPLKAIGFYEVSQHNRGKSIAFGATFSLGLIASFALLGVVVVVKQAVGWGEIYSNVWFNLAIVLLLLVMAVGTFGAFSVNLPTAVYSVTPRHDTYLGNFQFGVLTAVLSTPCTFGLFLVTLVWAAKQPAVVGVTLLMTVGAGMASPYFLLSAFPEVARKFPRTGPWSELTKQLMAFLLLGSAVFFARRFLVPVTGPDGFWWLMFAVATAAAGFLFFKTTRLSTGVRARAIAGGVALLIVVGTLAAVVKIVHQPYAWKPYTPDALETARQSKRVVVVEFTATWCSNCEYLEFSTLHQPQVVKTVKANDVEMLRADVTTQDAPGWTLLKQVNPVAAIPFTVVYGPATSEPQRLGGIYSAADLSHAIEAAAHKTVAQAW